MLASRYASSIIPPNICLDHLGNQRQTETIIRQLYITERLRTHLSIKYLIIHSIIFLFTSSILIILQILSIIEKSASYSTGSGIWVGFYFIITSFVTIALVKFRSYKLLIATFMLHFFGIFISGFTSIFFNIAYSSNQSLNHFNMMMLAIGLFISFLCILYIVFIECMIKSWKKRSSNSRLINNNNANRMINHHSGFNHISYNPNSSYIDSFHTDETNQHVFSIQPTPPPTYESPPSYDYTLNHNIVVTNRSIQIK